MILNFPISIFCFIILFGHFPLLLRMQFYCSFFLSSQNHPFFFWRRCFIACILNERLLRTVCLHILFSCVLFYGSESNFTGATGIVFTYRFFFLSTPCECLETLVSLSSIKKLLVFTFLAFRHCWFQCPDC
jgi:hypothetical protein